MCCPFPPDGNFDMLCVPIWIQVMSGTSLQNHLDGALKMENNARQRFDICS